MEDGDFSRYVISQLAEWSSEKLREEHNPTHRELHDQFVESLSNRQKKAFDNYSRLQASIALLRSVSPDLQQRMCSPESKTSGRNAALQQSLKVLIKALGQRSKKCKLFHDIVVPYLTHPHTFHTENHFDSEMARRWMMQKIINLGWTVERFGECDRHAQSSYGREAHKTERIGKKYQWLAYHELLARLSDNFKLLAGHWGEDISEYHGPWNVGHGRDIDPSNLLRKTEREGWGIHQNTWWFPLSYSSWQSPTDTENWLRTTEDLPTPEPLIEVTQPTDHSRWFVLDAYYEWGQPISPGEDRYKIPRWKIWYTLKSYLVRKNDAAKVFAWVKKQNFMGRWMLESHDSTEIFLGEFFWSPVFQDHDRPYFHRDGWTQGNNNHIPAKVLNTTDGYMQERGTFDCSIDDTMIISLPCKLLAAGMGIHWNGIEGHFFDKQGNLIAFDPSVRTPGPGALLIRREPLIEFLNANDLEIIWTLLREKEYLDGSTTRKDYKGRLKISGAYRFIQGKIQGTHSGSFIAPS